MKKSLLSFTALALVASGSVFAMDLQPRTIKQFLKENKTTIATGGVGCYLMFSGFHKLKKHIKNERAEGKTWGTIAKEAISKGKPLIATGLLTIGAGLEIYVLSPHIKSLCPDLNKLLFRIRVKKQKIGTN